jgi:regulation of enolase protein 1 (concanavalin A-like superfamily)
VVADRLETNATNRFVGQSFASAFAQVPVMLAAVTSVNEEDAVAVRLRDVTTTGFQVGMREQELNTQTHLTETIDYLALEPSFGVVNGVRYEVDHLPSKVNHVPQTLFYQTALTQPPLLLADMQTMAGRDTANLRWQNRDEFGVELWVAEEQSYDSELNHVGESVGYLVIEPNTSGGALASPWSSSDVGTVGLAGSAEYDNGTYTLQGSGRDIWDTVDAFHFAYQPLHGDGTITARVASVDYTDAWAKAGVMIRESLDANARHAMVVVTPANGVAFQRRLTTGGSSSHTAGASARAPYWVRLTRSGNTFTAYQSVNGTTWVQVGSANISMATSAYVGLALTSHNNSLLTTATLDGVSIQ